MSEYTTVTLTKDIKDQLSDSMQEGETWNEYLQRLQAESSDQEPTESSLSEEDFSQIRAIVQETSQETVQADAAREQFEDVEIDYDYIREIVREEVRRALEELVR
ncbi:hypothetical protein [Halosimplex pelagicum]|uniref:Uncharacterized protein n=1 Tax=Halosimplex pelagicum TaxID=869886 RepID=A0A7D5SXE4_9EURY|nr:hypothetical protein [Halosimplex pelagicum]QLH83847.1 hypothetical protein HZS54_20405 [Halosimplex pelagicum]